LHKNKHFQQRKVKTANLLLLFSPNLFFLNNRKKNSEVTCTPEFLMFRSDQILGLF
jgi:hypothetical protein